MYLSPTRQQSNPLLAQMQRTYNPSYVNYYGNGSGRDNHIVMDNGGLNHSPKNGLGHGGIHFNRYNSTVNQRKSISPRREATTFNYQSDGSGRDSYIIQDSGGLRPDYDRNNPSVEKIFKGSLRSNVKSPLKYFKDGKKDRADITTYLNWTSNQGKAQNALNAKIQRDLVKRLTAKRKTFYGGNYFAKRTDSSHQITKQAPPLVGVVGTKPAEGERLRPLQALSKKYTPKNLPQAQVFRNGNAFASTSHLPKRIQPVEMREQIKSSRDLQRANNYHSRSPAQLTYEDLIKSPNSRQVMLDRKAHTKVISQRISSKDTPFDNGIVHVENQEHGNDDVKILSGSNVIADEHPIIVKEHLKTRQQRHRPTFLEASSYENGEVPSIPNTANNQKREKAANFFLSRRVHLETEPDRSDEEGLDPLIDQSMFSKKQSSPFPVTQNSARVESTQETGSYQVAAPQLSKEMTSPLDGGKKSTTHIDFFPRKRVSMKCQDYFMSQMQAKNDSKASIASFQPKVPQTMSVTPLKVPSGQQEKTLNQIQRRQMRHLGSKVLAQNETPEQPPISTSNMEFAKIRSRQNSLERIQKTAGPLANRQKNLSLYQATQRSEALHHPQQPVSAAGGQRSLMASRAGAPGPISVVDKSAVGGE